MGTRILLISNLYPSEDYPSYGTFVRTIYQNYKDLGYSVDLVVLNKKKGENKLKTYLKFYSRVFAKLKTSDHDVINVHYPSHSAIPLLWHTKKLKNRLLTTIHGGDALPVTWIQRLMNPLTRKILQMSRRVVCSSETYRDLVLKQYKLSPHSVVTCAPGGINPGIFYPGSQPEREVRKLGYVGRLIRDKGLFDLIEAWKRMPKNIELEIVGIGKDEADLHQLVKKNDMTNVKFLGQVPQINLGDFYRNLDGLVFPTKLQESFGLVALEALACGIPIIASDIPAMKTIIRPDFNGWFFQMGDVSELANQMISFTQKSIEERINIYHQAIQSAEPYLISNVIQETKRLVDEF